MIKKAILLTSLVSVFFACNKEDEIENVPEVTGANSVTLSVRQEAFTKSIEDKKNNTDRALIGSAKIYFIDSLDVSVFQRQLTSSEITALSNPTTKEVTISGVPSSAKRLFFVANIKTDVFPSYPLIEGTNKDDARLRLDRLQGNTQYVPMSGISNVFQKTGSNTYAASVEIKPLPSRLEIGKITSVNNSTSGVVNSDIKSYKLSGIFIDNVHPYVLLSALPYLNNPVSIVNQAGWLNSSWQSYFTGNAYFPYYSGGSLDIPSGWATNTFVQYCTPQNTGTIFYPDQTYGATTTDPGSSSNLSWAFQVSPSTKPASGQTTPVADLPHIILQLTNVVYQGDTDGPTTLYVVVSKFKTNPGNVSVLQFDRGNVYRIEDLVFSQSQATSKPYDSNITVTCTVTVSPWTINLINPEW